MTQSRIISDKMNQLLTQSRIILDKMSHLLARITIIMKTQKNDPFVDPKQNNI